MREKIALKAFEATELPRIQRTYGDDAAGINAHIQKHFDLFKLDAGGNEIAVTYEVAIEEQASPLQDNDQTITKLAKAFVAEQRKNVTTRSIPTNIEVGGTGGLPFGRAADGTLKAYPNTPDGERKAFAMGAWALANFGGRNQKALEWCGNNLHTKAGHLESVNASGGVLVPEELSSDIIRLLNKFGKFRANCGATPMSSDTKTIPRRTGGLTAHFIGEGAAGTESTGSWDNVRLTARKLMILSKMSNELYEDAVVNLGDELSFEAAFAMGFKEDSCGFIGDGTSTYGGILGVGPKLTSVWTSLTADSAGVVIATGNTMAEVVLNDLIDVVARCPAYAKESGGAKWYCSSFFRDNVMVRLALASGGITLADVVRGQTPSFLGYEVVTTETMPSTDTNSQMLAYFGNLQQGAKFGDRREIRITISEHGTVGGVDVFNSDQLAIRATERFDINVHDVGDGSSTAGPIVGLRALNS